MLAPTQSPLGLLNSNRLHWSHIKSQNTSVFQIMQHIFCTLCPIAEILKNKGAHSSVTADLTMIQRAHWGQSGEKNWHKSQCNSSELCVNTALQADCLPQPCLSSTSWSMLKSLIIKLPQTISCDGLDPYLLPPCSAPYPTLSDSECMYL